MKNLLLTLFALFMVFTGFAQQPLNNALLLEYYQNQRFAEANEYLRSAYPEPVTDIKALPALAYTAQMAGKLPEAEGYYLRILEKDTTNVPVLLSLGNINIRRGNNVRALKYYQNILNKDSTNFSVYRQLATLSRNMGNIENTVVYLQKANQLNPQNGDVAYDLLTYYLPLKQFTQADKVISTALAADTSNLLLTKGKAQVMYQMNKPDETIALCKKLIAEGDSPYQVVSMLGTSYYIKKQYKDCIEAFDVLTASETHTEASWYYTGMSYKMLKQHTKAIKCFESSIKEAISPTVDSYYSEMAGSYDELGKARTALSMYQKALQFKERPITYYAMATLYDSKLNNPKLAIKYYKKYLAADLPKSQQQYAEYSAGRLKVLSR